MTAHFVDRDLQAAIAEGGEMTQKRKKWGLLALIYKSNPMMAEIDGRAPYELTKEFLENAVSKKVKKNWIIVLYENPNVGLNLVKRAKEKGFEVKEDEYFYYVSA